MSLTAEEREVVLVFNDADRCWHVYSDSLTLRGAIAELIQRTGVTPTRLHGGGIEFDLPVGRGVALPGAPTPRPSEKTSPVAGFGEALPAKHPF